MPANIIELQPKDATVHCDSCSRPCSEDELSECYTCHTRYCSRCWECACDRLAEHLLARVVDHRRNQSIFARVRALFFRPA
jgi:hypothetical protein